MAGDTNKKEKSTVEKRDHEKKVTFCSGSAVRLSPPPSGHVSAPLSSL